MTTREVALGLSEEEVVCHVLSRLNEYVALNYQVRFHSKLLFSSIVQ